MTSVPEIIEAHVRGNLGIYFSGSDELGPDVRYAWSESIKDHYWNYAYHVEGLQIGAESMQSIRDAAGFRDREIAIWQDAEHPTPEGWAVASSEAWMTCDLADIRPSDAGTTLSSTAVTIRPTPDMVEVFNDAYGSAALEGQAGYFELPPEYGRAYAAGEAIAPGKSFAVAVRAHDETVSVASVSVIGALAGLYSVATRHAARRRGFGKVASIAALVLAAQNGASMAFLQTEADSPVERMYESIGFSRLFVGSLLTPVS